MQIRVLALLSLFFAMNFALAEVPVRVLIDEISGSVTIQMNGPHKGYVDGRLRFETQGSLSWPLVNYQGQVQIDGESVGRSLTLEPADKQVTWQGESYRGGLRFLASGTGFKVINVIDLESYLRGVVPAEMQASWPLEALKAQAVAARTYTLNSLDLGADYDICATTQCQKYSGINSEHPRSDQAILETRGHVLIYEGQFARTYYHSDSGGVLAASSEVWGNTLPYLLAQQDISFNTPHRQWEKNLEPSVIAASLQERGIDLGEIIDLRILAYSSSGRVSSIEITGTTSRTALSGWTLTKLLRSWGLKSTRFSLTDKFVARGDGWGHGVGMSQYGARELASTGYQYSQILGFYYPSTSLQVLPYGLQASVD